jgi:hypothetical protein
MSLEERLRSLEDESLYLLEHLLKADQNLLALYEHVRKMKQGSFGDVER